jgi:hypothetical protein
MIWLIALCAVLLLLALAAWFVLVPWLRLSLRRRASREHRPQPMEIWVQDDALLYIEAVDATGVELLTFDRQKHVHRWKDTWADWNTRLQNRTVWFTGQAPAPRA